MKKTFAIAMMLVLAFYVNAQDIYSVGYYNVGEGYNAAIYKNGEKLYTAHHYNQTSKATRVTCDSQGNVYWFINFYDYPSNTYSFSEIRKNGQVYDTNENHREVHVTDMYCLNDTIYYTGYQYNEDSIMVATVWKGHDFITHWTLGDGVHHSTIARHDIDKQTNIPYFCGYIINDKQRASVWKGQNLLFTFDQDSVYSQAEITSSKATQIAIGNDHIYTMGNYEVEGAVPLDAIWEDNEIISSIGPYYDYYHNICFFGNSLYNGYVTRDYSFSEIISGPDQQMLVLCSACKILSTNSNIYVVGVDFDNKYYVWKNFEKYCQIEDCNGLLDACTFDPNPFISPNSEWYYEIQNDDGSITYQHLEYAADTTIGTTRPKVIVRSNTHYDREAHTEVTHEYILEENNKVYWWNKDLQEYTTLYDYGAEAGDEWEIRIGTESITVHVDNVDVFEYQGETHKMLQISDVGNIFNGDIVVGYGHLTSFFPERLMRDTEGFRVNGLRCYWVEDALLYHNGNEDCDAVYSELHSVDETCRNAFTVFPNPANTLLFVETRFIASQPTATTYRITNLMGQTVMTGVLTVQLPQCDSPTTIDVSNLPAGMYFISVGEQTMKFVVR